MIAPNDRPGPAHTAAGERAAIPLDFAQSPLWEELGQHLDREARHDLDTLRDELPRLPWAGTPPAEALTRALERADPAELTTLAHRLGREWIAGG